MPSLRANRPAAPPGTRRLAYLECGPREERVRLELRAFRPGLVVPTNRQTEARLEMVVRGRHEEECDGLRRVGTPGRCFYRPAGARVCGRVAEEGLVELDICIAPEVSGSPRAEGHPAMGPLAATMLDEILLDDASSPLALESLAVECLTLVRRTRHVDERSPPWLSAVRERLHDIAAAAPTVADLAALADVHRSHLIRSFGRVLGVTPGQYRRLVLLQEAATQIASTDTPIAVIAQALGFADQSHLGRCFRRAYDQTPGRFRRLLRRAQLPS